MAKILVTGGAGFIGSYLVDYLVSKKHSVVVFDDLSVGLKRNVNRQARLIRIKVQDRKVLAIFKKYRFDFVYHLAAQKNLQYSLQHPAEDAQTNIIGSLNILNAARENKAKKIIFFSSAAVYDAYQTPPNHESDDLKPVTPYGISKMAVEKYIINSDLPYTILRPANVYGPRQDASGEGGVVAIFCKNLILNKPSLIFNSGHQTRDFVYVHDVVQAAFSTINKGKNAIINVSTSKETSVSHLYALLNDIARKKIRPRYGKRIKEQYHSALSNIIAKRILNWNPDFSIIKGLKETYNWFSKFNE